MKNFAINELTGYSNFHMKAEFCYFVVRFFFKKTETITSEAEVIEPHLFSITCVYHSWITQEILIFKAGGAIMY